MRHEASIQWAGLVCGLAVVGCSSATPPQPAPQPPKPVAVAPATTDSVAEAVAPAAAVEPAAAAPAATQPMPQAPPAAVVPPSAPAAAEGGDAMAALRSRLTAATEQDARVLAIDDLAALGQNARPALEELVACTADANPRVRWHAARAIGLIGEDAIGSLPVLLKLLEDADPIVATQAAAAVGLIREDDGRTSLPEADVQAYAAAVEPLGRAATHPDARVRRAAVRALRRLSPGPGQLAQLLSRRLLADADPSVVMPALHTLADMDGEAVPFLLEALKEPKSRYWAAVALTEIGPEAAAAVEPLAGLAAAGESEERMQALLALAAIGPQAATAAPVMLESLQSDDSAVRFAAAFALGSVRAAGADETLAAITKAADPFLAEIASWALARIHPDDKTLVDEAVRRLRGGLHGDRPKERAAAASGLSDLATQLDEPARRELAAEFAAALADNVPDVGINAGAALIRLGPSSVDALREKLSDPALRAQVLEIFAALGPAAKPAVSDLIRTLDDGDPAIRGDAAVALAAVGADAAAAVPMLSAMLADPAAVPGTRYAAAYALGRIGGPAAKPAVETLRTLSDSQDEMMATVAVWALLKIEPQDGPLVEKAIPILRRAARAEREVVRLEAAVALGDIGPAASSAIPILELISEDDPSRAVRDAAAAALKKIRTP